jgi:uncharacterized protein (DUF2141 family)
MIRTLMLLCALAVGAAAQAPAEPNPVVSGRTLDEKGQPVRKIALTLLPLETSGSGEPLAPYGVTSDNAGRFEFYGVTPGRYRLMAERTGYLSAYYGARNTWAAGAVLTLREGEHLTNVTIRMVEQSAISGKVIADESAVMVMVYLLQQRYQSGRRQWVRVASAMSDSAGEFRINKLPSGRYRLAAESAGGAMQVQGKQPERDILTYYPGVASAESAEAIELHRGQTISDLRLPLRKSPLFAVSGTIVRKPSASARVQLHLASSSLGTSFNTVATGDKFRIESVQPGSYLLGVLETSGSGSVRMVTQQPVEVSAGDIEDLTLDLDPSAGLHGTVRFAGGPPIGAKLRIQVVPAYGDSRFYKQAEVNADGTFTILGSFAGAYRFDIQGLPADAYIKSAVYGEKDALGGFDLARTGGNEKLEIVVGANAARVSGVVRDEKGKTLDGVVILIPDPPQPQRASLYQLAQADETGRFQFQGLRPGKYRLYAWEEFEDGSQFDLAVTAPLQARSLALEVAEGERKEVEVARIAVEEVEAAHTPR